MNTVEALFTEMLSGLAKVALSLDADHQQQLAMLEGRSLRIDCTNPPQRITLRVTAGELAIVPGSDIPTDATVTGTFTDLLTLVRGSQNSQESAANRAGLQVAGDALVMRDFARFFESYSPDWTALMPQAGTAEKGKDFSSGFPPGPGNDLFETLRGTAEIGLASLGKAIGSVMQGGATQVRDATRETFTGDNEFAAATQRLQTLSRKAQDLTQRVDTLADAQGAPSAKE